MNKKRECEHEFKSVSNPFVCICAKCGKVSFTIGGYIPKENREMIMDTVKEAEEDYAKNPQTLSI